MQLSTEQTRIWRPFTQMKTAAESLKVQSGQGIMLQLEDGREVMDMISSWWVNIHGHGNPVIAEAIHAQALKCEQVIFADFVHDPALELTERLEKLLPEGLSHFFFSDNGSTAVEVSLKMSLQYWQNQGEKQRTRFVAFEGAYHGDTVGAMSVSAESGFNNLFQSLMFEVDRVPYPETHDGDEGIEEREQEVLKRLQELLSSGQHAGVIIEPLVQGAGGMRCCRPEFLRDLEQLVRNSGSLLIYDEVMTGFGRTGEWFASRKSKSSPDIICLSKGITGGTLPLSVTVCKDQVYDAFYSDDPHKAFYHGHSFTANPLGCAAANASLQLLEENQEMFRQIEGWHRAELQKLSGHPRIQRQRTCGTIAAMDLVTEKGSGYFNPIGKQLQKLCFDNGVYLRPLGSVLYLLPPYCITKTQLEEAYAVITHCLETLNTFE